MHPFRTKNKVCEFTANAANAQRITCLFHLSVAVLDVLSVAVSFELETTWKRVAGISS